LEIHVIVFQLTLFNCTSLHELSTYTFMKIFRNVQFTLSKDQISLSVPYSLPSTFNICYEWQPFNKHSLPRELYKLMETS